MARADILLNLVKAGGSGDRALFRKALEALIADERGKQHNVLAGRLAAYLNSAPPSNNVSKIPLDADPRPHPRYARSSSAISSFSIWSRASVTRFARAGSGSLVRRSRTAGTTCHLSP